MSDNVNKIRNPDFSKGASLPTNWTWSATTKGTHASKMAAPKKKAATKSAAEPEAGPEAWDGILISSKRATGAAWWSQEVTCKPEQHYRVEVVACCDLETVDDDDPSAESAGFVLAIEPVEAKNSKKNSKKKATGPRLATPGLLRSPDPSTVRAYYEAQLGVRRVRISVGIDRAEGTARVHEVRFIPILTPEADSHPMAIPAPAHTDTGPRSVDSVCVCSATADTRPITDRLAGVFGEPNVSAISPDALDAKTLSADALLLPEAKPPASIKTLRALLNLTKDKIVVISLPAFSKLSSKALSVRHVDQNDDPIHARIDYANHATRGFALYDMIPYAWGGTDPGSFAQNHYRRSATFTAFVKKHGLSVLMTSVCDQDVTSQRPISLFRMTDGGALFVLDIEPAEEDGSTFAEPTLAMHLLLNVLGKTQNHLGQFVAPLDTEAEFRGLLRDMTDRFEHFVVHDEDLPIDEITEQVITIGKGDESFGLPLKPKPIILIRTGLNVGDVETSYGALLWFKQLIRMKPFDCAYAKALCSRFRLVWIPLASTWEASMGWHRSRRAALQDTEVASGPSEIVAMIDIATGPRNEIGVVLPSHEGAYRRCIDWLPRTFAAFPPGDYYTPCVDDGDSFQDRSRIAWRQPDHSLQFIVDTEAFESQAHKSVIAGGGQVIRIEVPSSDLDFISQSIARTDLVATLLEQVVGLHYGLIAVNRSADAVNFEGNGPVQSGETLILDHDSRLLQANATQAG